MTTPGLRNRPCPLCGSTDATAEVVSAPEADTLTLAALEPYWFGIDKERRFFSYYRCSDCSLLYNRTFFDGQQLGQLYSRMPPNMDQVESGAILATQRGYFQAVAGGDLTGDYLEIGPDVGYIVREAAARGNFDKYWLFEPNEAVHDTLRAACGDRPANLLTDMTNLSAVPAQSVGLAVMIHVLDHLLDPVAMLAAIRDKLRPGGTLLIVTHDEKSGLSRILRRRWPAFCLQHPELYNPVTIRCMLGKAGFDRVTVARSVNHFPMDFLAKQALQAAGLRLSKLPLPSRSIGLRLGNILTVATAPDHMAESSAGVASAA